MRLFAFTESFSELKLLWTELLSMTSATVKLLSCTTLVVNGRWCVNNPFNSLIESRNFSLPLAVKADVLWLSCWFQISSLSSLFFFFTCFFKCPYWVIDFFFCAVRVKFVSTFLRFLLLSLNSSVLRFSGQAVTSSPLRIMLLQLSPKLVFQVTPATSVPMYFVYDTIVFLLSICCSRNSLYLIWCWIHALKTFKAGACHFAGSEM